VLSGGTADGRPNTSVAHSPAKIMREQMNATRLYPVARREGGQLHTAISFQASAREGLAETEGLHCPKLCKRVLTTLRLTSSPKHGLVGKNCFKLQRLVFSKDSYSGQDVALASQQYLAKPCI
jgi:hypothetical protein